MTTFAAPPPANLKALGLAVASTRRAREMTLEDLAEGAGTSRQTIINVEMAHKAARIDTLHAIAHALGEPLASLISALDTPPQAAPEIQRP